MLRLSILFHTAAAFPMLLSVLIATALRGALAQQMPVELDEAPLHIMGCDDSSCLLTDGSQVWLRPSQRAPLDLTSHSETEPEHQGR